LIRREIEVLNSSQHPEFVECEKSEVIPEKAPGESESLVNVPLAAVIDVYRDNWLVPFLVTGIFECCRIPA
tara:strand:- start:399 stop:611 length:213 start_codon:yes stop_codon:yes gene_type:complete